MNDNKKLQNQFEFRRSTPESTGVSSRVILNCLREMEACGTEMHGFCLYRKGNIIAQTNWKPYSRTIPHTNHSMGKSYTAAAVGIACGEGLLSTEDTIAEIYADELKRWNIHPSPNFCRIKIKHLLSMSAGMKKMPPFNDNWVLEYLRSEPEYQQGEHFLYDTSGASLLGAIVEKKTGMSLKDYMTSRMFQKIGIDPQHFLWLKFPNGCNAEPGTCSTEEDNLRLGLLYMNNGLCNGEQIIPQDFAEQATSFQVSTAEEGTLECRQGYGYQLWLCSTPKTFRFDGGQGQLCVVSKKLGLIASVHEGASVPKVGPRPLEIMLKHLFAEELPDSIPEDPEAYKELSDYLATRSVEQVPTCNEPERLARFNGVYLVRQGNPNPWIEVCPAGVNFFDLFYDKGVNPLVEKVEVKCKEEECQITINDRTVFCGRYDGQFTVHDTKNVLPLEKSCCSTYMEDDRLCMDVRWLNGWFRIKLEFELSEDGNQLNISVRKNTLNELTPYIYTKGIAERIIR